MNIIEMFEAVGRHRWMINNDIHRLDVVAGKKKNPSNWSRQNQTFLYLPQTQPRGRGGNH